MSVSAEAKPAGEAGRPSAARFRQVLGHFGTGVTVITTLDDDGPCGFACQAFAALSLDPPLVLFCPGRLSGTWQRIARAGHFCANILAATQEDVSRIFGSAGSSADKFAQVRWSVSGTGAPILDGALTWAACTVCDVHEAGDHYVVIGSVIELGPCRTGEPLLFYRGRYGTSRPTQGPPEVVGTLLSWPSHADWI